MTWNNPLWRAESITDDKLNSRLRDNMLTLKNPAHADSAPPYVTGSPSDWELIAPNLELTLDTLGGDVLLLFRAKANNCVMSFFVDESNVGGNDGIFAFPNIGGAGGGMTGQMIWLVRDLNAGTHTFGVYWKGGALVSTVPPVFSAREIS
jgi:hypothetical protein